MDRIIKDATEVINYVKSKGLEVRFSSEDSFRSDLVDLLNLYKAVDQLGVNRVGIADTVGCANPRQVYDLVKTLRSVLKPTTDIECHFHNGKHLHLVLALFFAPFTRNTFPTSSHLFLASLDVIYDERYEKQSPRCRWAIHIILFLVQSHQSHLTLYVPRTQSTRSDSPPMTYLHS